MNMIIKLILRIKMFALIKSCKRKKEKDNKESYIHTLSMGGRVGKKAASEVDSKLQHMPFRLVCEH